MAAIGLDLGTTSIKLCVVDSQGNILSSDKRHHKQDKSITSGIQDGQKIIELALEMLTDPSRRWLKVTDIYIAGQMHGIVLWKDEDITNGDLSSLSPFHTWTYQNEPGVIEEIKSYMSEGTRVHEGFGCASLVELMRNNYNQRYNRCGTIMDLLACVLTQSREVKMSEQLAESWGLTIRREEIIEWDGIFEGKMKSFINLPTIVQAPACLGKSALKDLENVNVHLPAGDLQASVCSLAGQPDHKFASDTAYIVIGTSAQLCTVQTKDICSTIDLSNYSAVQQLSFNKDYNLIAACSMNGGNAVESSIKVFTYFSCDFANFMEELHTAVETNSVDKNVKATSVRFLPERDQDGETGLAISGIQKNTKLNDILAAVATGVIDNLFSLFPLELFETLKIKRVFLIGEANEPAYSNPISKKFSEYEVEIQRTHAKINASLGAILLNM